MKSLNPFIRLALLASAAFTLGTVLHPRAQVWARSDDSGGLLETIMGDGRRLFANHFFVKADVAFHGGYYPSVFDTATRPKNMDHLQGKEVAHEGHAGEEPAEHGQEGHVCTDDHEGHDHEGHECTGDHGEEEDHASAHEKEMAFLQEPMDWIERFGRRFIITQHAHLGEGEQREMLPWLRIAAELDPDQPETYTVAAYWLRSMKKSPEAEQFLREGLRNIPNSFELYFDLGDLYLKDRNQPETAKNLWDIALIKWVEAEKAGKKPDPLELDRIAVHLANLEEERGNIPRAVQLLTLAKQVSPQPATIQTRIDDMLNSTQRSGAAEPQPN